MLCYQYCSVLCFPWFAAQQTDHGPNNTRVKDNSGLAQLGSYCHYWQFGLVSVLVTIQCRVCNCFWHSCLDTKGKTARDHPISKATCSAGGDNSSSETPPPGLLCSIHTNNRQGLRWFHGSIWAMSQLDRVNSPRSGPRYLLQKKIDLQYLFYR